jgi:uncharacterized protein (TIGR02996 family)
MNLTADDRAFLAAVAAAPADDTPRLVYADWLDERSDPRGPYLRAEVAHAGKPTKAAEKRVRTLLAAVDPVWANMVSRPPFGVLVPGLTFADSGPPIGPDFLKRLEKKYGGPLPPDYAAFLLLHNGGVPSWSSLSPADWQLPLTRLARFYSSDDPLDTELPALTTSATEHFAGDSELSEKAGRSVILIARVEDDSPEMGEDLFYLGIRVGKIGRGTRLLELSYHGNTGLLVSRFSHDEMPRDSFAGYLAGLRPKPGD